MFLNIFTNGLLRWIRLCSSDVLIPISIYFDKIKKIASKIRFSATKSHLRWSVLILSKNAFSNWCLTLKTHQLLTAWFVFHENVLPLVKMIYIIVGKKLIQFWKIIWNVIDPAFVLFLGCVLLTSLFMILIPARRHRSLKTLVQVHNNNVTFSS